MSSKVESPYSGTFLFFEFLKNLTNSRKYAKTAYIFLFFSFLKEFLNKSKMMLHYLNDSSVKGVIFVQTPFYFPPPLYGKKNPFLRFRGLRKLYIFGPLCGKKKFVGENM